MFLGGRTADSIVSWALEKWASQQPPPEIYQLTEQSIMDKCTEKQLCFISFLPHILDSGADGRNSYLDIARAVGTFSFSLADFFIFLLQASNTSSARLGGCGSKAELISIWSKCWKWVVLDTRLWLLLMVVKVPTQHCAARILMTASRLSSGMWCGWGRWAELIWCSESGNLLG